MSLEDISVDHVGFPENLNDTLREVVHRKVHSKDGLFKYWAYGV